MTKEESQAFLSKLGLKWFYLKPNERKNFEEKFNESKKSYKKSVKEFIIVSLYLFEILCWSKNTLSNLKISRTIQSKIWISMR